MYNLTHAECLQVRYEWMIAGYYKSLILAARQPQVATSLIQAITGEGLAQGPYVAARGGVEPATFRTKGTKHHHSTNHVPVVVPFRLPTGFGRQKFFTM